MKNFKELESVLLDQIEKLNDDSIGVKTNPDGTVENDPEEIKAMVERSKAISELTKNVVEMNRLKLDIVKECNSNGGLYEKYLGIDDGKK